MKKLIPHRIKKKTIKRIYVVIYDQQEFLGYDNNTPIKAFKTRKTADIYASSRNFEFQTLCLLGEDQYENYVLDNAYGDFVISVSDFRDAYSFIKEEMIMRNKTENKGNVWDIVSSIKPFKVMPIEYIDELKNF